MECFLKLACVDHLRRSLLNFVTLLPMQFKVMCCVTRGAHLVIATSSLPKVGVIHTMTYSRNDHFCL